MNILLVTNNLYATGGDWTYVKEIYDIYQSHGHNVYMFGMKMDQNLDKTYQDYYVTYYDLSIAKKHPIKSGVKALSTSLYSKEAIRNITKFIKDFSIDIVQINSIHLGVTASIIRAIHKLNIPIVYRTIDYSQVCPNIHMIRDGKICKECLGNNFYNCIRHNCKKSLFTSLFVSANAYFYTLRGDYKLVDMYSFQNDYMRNLFIKRCGYNREHTITINNPYDSYKTTPDYNLGSNVLFIARLEPEKGILTFIEAAKLNPGIKHQIVGTGTLTDVVKEKIKDFNNIKYLGSVWGAKLDAIIKKSRFVVCPSEWEEPSSYVAFQTFSCGKPVIASKRGGLPEVVEDHYNGVLFDAGDIQQLAEKIKWFDSNEDLVLEYGKNARKTVETKFSNESYYNETMNLFKQLLERNK